MFVKLANNTEAVDRFTFRFYIDRHS